MITPFIAILLGAFAESIVSFSGAALVIFKEARIRKFVHFFVSFAVGALLGVAFFELIPEAIEMGSMERVLPWVLGGIILFFILEKMLFWYHCHDGVCQVHAYTYLILWGDALHNFIDGIIIALAFLADMRLGILTTFAILLHEVPQEVGDFSILIHGGMSHTHAFRYNFLVSLTTIGGAVITYLVGSRIAVFLPQALALVAGNFIYLATTDLMPELHEATGTRHGLIQIVCLACGVAIIVFSESLLGHG
ncbi:MAG: Zinc transporter ZIP [Parcubacteria group bacterium Gr01-1014_48]|nr:MAG: Zinc transporter ZIP [Parcubacteria group bacterium Gr01-1014_48]